MYVVKSLKGKTNGCEIIFNGKSEATLDGILGGGVNIFQDFTHIQFDNVFKYYVDSSVVNYMQSSPDHDKDLKMSSF